MMGTMFRDLFGAQRSRKARMSPQDLRYTVTVSLLEAAVGCQKEVRFHRKLPSGEEVEEKLLFLARHASQGPNLPVRKVPSPLSEVPPPPMRDRLGKARGARRHAPPAKKVQHLL